MKRRLGWWWVATLWGAGLAASAQVELTWSLEHDRTVLMEPIHATVRIANYSGHSLDLTPRGNARLLFDVEDQPTSNVQSNGQPLVKQAVIVPDGETREVVVNLLDAYRMVKGQSYMLTPVLEFGGMRFAGQRKSIEIQPGLELLRRKYGLPATGDAREVSLRLIFRDRGDRLLLRIDDYDTGYCLGVYELGRIIRFFVPRLERDRDGVFHVLHQSSPDRFVESTFGGDGKPLGMAFYGGQVGRIRMVRGEDGTVTVTGGTAYTEDPAHPGRWIGPELSPAHSAPTTLEGAAGRSGKSTGREPPVSRKKAVRQAASENNDAGSETVSW